MSHGKLIFGFEWHRKWYLRNPFEVNVFAHWLHLNLSLVCSSSCITTLCWNKWLLNSFSVLNDTLHWKQEFKSFLERNASIFSASLISFPLTQYSVHKFPFFPNRHYAFTFIFLTVGMVHFRKFIRTAKKYVSKIITKIRKGFSFFY